MITAIGQTFQHRETLKAFHGRWNAETKAWDFDYLTASQIETLRGLVGVQVIVPVSRISFYDDEFDDINPSYNTPVIIGDDQTYFNHFANQDPIAYFGFSSMGVFIEHVASLTLPENRNGKCDIGWTAKEDYTGTKSLHHALEIARNGWVDGLGMMNHLLAPEPIIKRRIRSHAGGMVNVARMLAGQPNHMSRRKNQIGKRKFITLFVETVMWEGITIDTALIRVVAVAAIVDRLEHQGYSCNLVAVYSAMRRDASAAMQTAIQIKDAGEKLSLADISFTFGHPSFGRRLIYAIEGATPQCDLKRDIRGRISQAFNDEHPPKANEFYIPQIRHNLTDIWEMLELIQPDGLPVKIQKED